MMNPSSDFAESPRITPLKRLRHRVEYGCLFAVRAVMARCPLVVVRAAADVAGTLAAWFDRRGRSTALANLQAAFGARFSPAERKSLVGQCYRQFARTFFELFRVARYTPDEAARWFCIGFEDEAATVAAAKDGAIFITPHYGNFEWMAMAWCQSGHPLTFIAQDSKNPLVTPLFVEDRSRCGNTVIHREGALLKLLRGLKSGKQVGLLPDLTTSPKNSAAIIRMFGLKASVTSLPAALAVRTGCAVIPAICIPQPDGTHLGYFAKPIRFAPGTPMPAAAQALWSVFEPIISRQPAPWLWMYKHWRFLPEDARDGQYPAYANRNKAFDKLDNDSQV